LRPVVVHRLHSLPVRVAPFVANFGHFPEPMSCEIDAVEVGGVCNDLERCVFAELLAIRLQAFVDLIASSLDRHAVEIGAR
jgi:hypothetical protein